VRRSKRDKPKIIIPTKLEMRGMVEAARSSLHPMDAPLVLTRIFTGLRASELRGLGWKHIDLKARTLSVQQRADAQCKIGSPMSEAGRRIIPMADALVAELREWKLQCPVTELDLVFPSVAGKVISHGILHKLHL
jgi:integrase